MFSSSIYDIVNLIKIEIPALGSCLFSYTLTHSFNAKSYCLITLAGLPTATE